MTPLILALVALTQTTDIEREAAATILRQIDSLETRLKPTETAQRLAARADLARDRLLARVAAVGTRGLQGPSGRVRHPPQVGWHAGQGVATPTAGPPELR